MHDIEPFYKWRDSYIASEDQLSPFYGRTYNEFTFTKKIYNYYIHPQWDEFGSPTLYMKILFTDYEDGFACIELIGEWNDCITNDVMFLKREVIDQLIHNGVRKFIIFCENVLNFHGSDESYYEEWKDDISEDLGWVCLLNTLAHVQHEMEDTQLQYYVHLGMSFNNINWRKYNPDSLKEYIESIIKNQVKQLSY
jgi:hypothetical protein